MIRALAYTLGFALLPVAWPLGAVMAVMAHREQPELDALLSRPLVRRELERAS